MIRLLAAACVALAALSSCRAPPPPAAAPSPLMGTRWAMSGDALAPSIAFAQNRAGGSAGCNRWFAQVEGGHPELRFSTIGATRRVCDQELMETEHAFLAAIEATRSARIDGDTLTLLDEGGNDLTQLSRVH